MLRRDEELLKHAVATKEYWRLTAENMGLVAPGEARKMSFAERLQLLEPLNRIYTEAGGRFPPKDIAGWAERVQRESNENNK
ncbi:MAG: hypothetical protein V4709_05865 [Pseudomonadota bacterium]